MHHLKFSKNFDFKIYRDLYRVRVKQKIIHWGYGGENLFSEKTLSRLNWIPDKPCSRLIRGPCSCLVCQTPDFFKKLTYSLSLSIELSWNLMNQPKIRTELQFYFLVPMYVKKLTVRHRTNLDRAKMEHRWKHLCL